MKSSRPQKQCAALALIMALLPLALVACAGKPDRYKLPPPRNTQPLPAAQGTVYGEPPPASRIRPIAASPAPAIARCRQARRPGCPAPAIQGIRNSAMAAALGQFRRCRTGPTHD